jgi:prepilin-type processing-associated H-X9-DG protein
MLSESDVGWNASGDRSIMISRPRHKKGFNVLFCDGHTETVPKEGLDKLRWNP